MSKKFLKLQPLSLITVLQWPLIYWTFQSSAREQFYILAHHKPQFHFPLFQLDILAEPFCLLVLAVLITLATAGAILGNTRSTLALGMFAFIYMCAAPENRLNFSYFPALALMSIASAKLSHSLIPMVALSSSLYCSASLHKLVNFKIMLVKLPFYFHVPMNANIALLGSSLPDLLLQTFAWTVVPVEMAMGLLVMFKKTRIWGFLLTVLFHLSVHTFTGGHFMFTPVGFMLLSFNSLFVAYETDLTWKHIWFNGKFLFFVLFVLICFSASYFIEPGSLVYVAFEIVWMLGSFIAIIFLAFIWRKKLYTNNASFPQNRLNILSVSMLGFFVLWAISPAFINYRNDHFGWAMFSGATSIRPNYGIKVKALSCTENFNELASLWTTPIESDNTRVYFAKEIHKIERLKKHFEEVCPETHPSEVIPNISI